jgi:hypothetical protein
MHINYKNIFGRGLNALAATMLIAATVHLSISFIASLVSQNNIYINPIEFLGLGFILPQYLHSTAASALAWAILIGIFFVMFVLHAYLFIAVSIRTGQPLKVFKVGRESNGILRLMARRRIEPNTSKE